MFRAQKYLEIIEKEKLVANAAKMGDYMLKQTYELQEEFPDLISNSRGLGLMIAFVGIVYLIFLIIFFVHMSEN